jgi:hypothetical protein
MKRRDFIRKAALVGAAIAAPVVALRAGSMPLPVELKQEGAVWDEDPSWRMYGPPCHLKVVDRPSRAKHLMRQLNPQQQCETRIISYGAAVCGSVFDTIEFIDPPDYPRERVEEWVDVLRLRLRPQSGVMLNKPWTASRLAE